MLKLYEGNDIYTYVLNSGRELELSEEDVNDIISKSTMVENYFNLLEDYNNLENKFIDCNNQLDLLKEDYDKLIEVLEMSGVSIDEVF